MKVRLFRVDGCEALRTPWVDGEAVYPPRVGKSFELHAEPLDPAFDGRLVTTSRVVEIKGDGLFRTESGSLYRVEVLEGPFRRMAVA